MFNLLTGAAALLSLSALGYAAPLGKRSESGPVISSNFPDPSIIKVGDTWYAFGTNVDDNAAPHVQIATSTDFNSWTLTGDDALPNVPGWVYGDEPAIWAPDVIQNDNGQFVLFFSAAADDAHHCVGVATSDSVTGPYSAQDSAWACPLDQGGAIDPSSFRDVDGSRYVTYKVDGNSNGHGGVCNNGVDPIVSTPIMQQKVQGDGITPIGNAYEVLDRDDGDGPLVEAPSIMRTSDGRYILFFSSNCYSTINYDVTYAIADNVAGPYTKYGPLFVSQSTYGLWSPGGATIAADGQHLVFHAYLAAGSSIRGMYTAEISVSGNTVSA
ncbi:glycoside hydrolase family 43 protein [Saccharata proteae CBS 121410]|uniref:Glycoside hydrolase family 43 protein n=1 Tax=Saccharata proteae CBS 121410 TaxID=1314787 RepID=A0A9P4HUX3_9PEZI|nr:glycoside hydrolase family 43 protein [Saccharata proteae CBS 121410]